MGWNPGTYNQFKTERAAPFEDLLALLQVKDNLNVIDLGCGTGELTARLATALPHSKVTGIDSSAEMLEKANALQNDHLRFEQRGIEEVLDSDQQWDLIFSNAALQWVGNHTSLIPKIISKIKRGGQLLVQVPAQHHNAGNIILNRVAGQSPFNGSLQNWERTSAVLELADYAKLFFENGSKSMTVYEKIYPLILKDAGAVFNFVSGTALIPYLERLDDDTKAKFIEAYKQALRDAFPGSPAFYPFKRIILEAKF